MLKKVYPVTKVCLVLDYPRSSYYLASMEKDTDKRLRQAIWNVAGE